MRAFLCVLGSCHGDTLAKAESLRAQPLCHQSSLTPLRPEAHHVKPDSVRPAMLAHRRFRWSNILSAWDTETEEPGFPWSPPWPSLPGDNPLAFAN